ncbi:MAG TPA: hypothetical protein VK611_06935 [Acidimicrobiales bacterium]|nr:hypothetical protein [Acidimicrobiales bacterium]
MALAWAERHDIDDLHVVADAEAGLLARRAALFAESVPVVWQVTKTGLVEAEPSPPEPRKPSSAAPELVDLLIDQGLELVVEQGIVRGEVNGLELARITGDRLEVGVGAADRELTSMVHGDSPLSDQLERVAKLVRDLRRPDADRHPLNQLVPERWLRAELCRTPKAIGLTNLRPTESARPRRGLRELDIAVAVGESDDDGRPVVIACSVGIDLDLVPAAADARAALDPDADLWLVLPERDDHPSSLRMAARLHDPARILSIPDTWRSGLG